MMTVYKIELGCEGGTSVAYCGQYDVYEMDEVLDIVREIGEDEDQFLVKSVTATEVADPMSDVLYVDGGDEIVWTRETHHRRGLTGEFIRKESTADLDVEIELLSARISNAEMSRYGFRRYGEHDRARDMEREIEKLTAERNSKLERMSI